MTMSRLAFTALFATVTLAGVSVAQAAPILITYTGTVTSTDPGMGYAVNDPVTFAFTVNDYAPATPAGSVFTDGMYWQEENAAEPPLWANITGTGISGTYSRASGSGPYDTLYVYDSGEFYTDMNTDGFEAGVVDHGIYLAADQAYKIDYLDFSNIFLTADGFTGFAVLGTLPNPTAYLANYLGTYGTDLNQDPYLSLEAENANGDTLFTDFRITSVAITAVPEPSTLALGAAGIAGAAWLRHRRRRAAAPQA